MSLTVIQAKRPGEKSHYCSSKKGLGSSTPTAWPQQLHSLCLYTALAGKEQAAGFLRKLHCWPFSSVVHCSFTLSNLFCFLQGPLFPCKFFCAVYGIFCSPGIFLFSLFYSFLCILNFLQLFLLNISLKTIFSPCRLCMDSYKYVKDPCAVSAAYMCSRSLEMFWMSSG